VDKLAQAAAQEGMIIIYGGLSGEPTVFPHWPAALKGLSLRGWVACRDLEPSGTLRALP
jgi:hypothetical protein